MPPGETMRVRSGIGQQDAIVCHLPIDRLSRWLDKDIEWTDRRLEASLDIGIAKISTLLVKLGDEARRPGFGSDVLCEAIAVQVAVHLERCYRGISDGAPIASGLASWRLRLIDDRLREVRQVPNLSELASLCRLSVRQLSRSFLTSRGISIGEHVARERIEHAKQLLNTCKSVKSVAATMGLASSSSFSYAFRNINGVSQSDFRTRS